MEDEFIEKQLIPYLTEKGVWVMADSTVYTTKFDGTPIRPMVSYSGFTNIGVESVTLSKEFGLPGTRIGGLVGNRDIVNAVRMLAGTEVDILPAAEQRIAAKALRRLDPCPVERRIAQELHTETLPRLAAMGWPVVLPHAGVDMVIEVPPKYKESGIQDPSLLASFSLLRRYGVGLCPASVFSTEGKNYLRLGLKQKRGKVPYALDIMSSQGFDWRTDEPSGEDIAYLEDKIRTLDLTRL
jgi:LL-diaminopimelate aminotransferase